MQAKFVRGSKQERDGETMKYARQMARQFRQGTSTAAIAAALVVWSSGCAEGTEKTEEVALASSALSASTAQAPSGGKYQAYQEYLQRQAGSAAVRSGAAGQGAAPSSALAPTGAVTLAATAGGSLDTLQEYAAKCDLATGVHVPAFSCENGIEVPGQGTKIQAKGVTCSHPNVLNNECDPGSKFQVLVRTADAVVVAHCRKDGQAAPGTTYNDIAVIQYNKKTGAQCFYQALTNLPGAAVTAPASGTSSAFNWKTPAETAGITCTGCHDNGGLIRSKYLAQLTSAIAGANAFPTFDTGFDNMTIPVKYVGRDFAQSRSWSITGPTPGTSQDQPCNSCHRLAVSNIKGLGSINGTAAHFAVQATQKIQTVDPLNNGASIITTTTVNGSTYSVPRWMRPGQTSYVAEAEASAAKFKVCAEGYWLNQSEGFQSGTATAGCTFTPLAAPWIGFNPAQAVVAVTSTLM
jgi:hypothetical protein